MFGLKPLRLGRIFICLFVFLMLMSLFNGWAGLIWLQLRLTWHGTSEKAIAFPLPEDVELVDIEVFVASNGDGYDIITLQLDSDQVKTILTEVKKNSEWDFETDKEKVQRRCSSEDDSYYFRYTDDGIISLLCPQSKMIRVINNTIYRSRSVSVALKPRFRLHFLQSPLPLVLGRLQQFCGKYPGAVLAQGSLR